MKESKTISIREYRNPPFRPFKNKGGYPEDLLIGFELETVLQQKAQANGNSVLLGDKFQHLSKVFYAKYDGSVYGPGEQYNSSIGIEMNSQPFNWNWFLSNKNYFYDLGKFLKETKSYCNRTCGFHVHICKSYFKEKAHLNRFLFMFYKEPNAIARISKRGIRSDHLSQYANPWAFDSDNLTLRSISSTFRCGEKYLAANICHEKTVEVRIFQSTINPMLFTAYLEFCVAMAIYTSDHRNILNIDSFKKYVMKNAIKYPNLVATKILISEHAISYKSDISGIKKNKFWKEILKKEVKAVKSIKAVKANGESTKKYLLTHSRENATV